MTAIASTIQCRIFRRFGDPNSESPVKPVIDNTSASEEEAEHDVAVARVEKSGYKYYEQQCRKISHDSNGSATQYRI